jgi:hypothetical protein
MLRSLLMGRKKLPIGQRRDAQVNFRCDLLLYREMAELARNRELTLAQLIRSAIKEYLAQQRTA